MIILIEISDFYIKFTHRTFTSAFIRDVDYAFKGENKRNYVYWASHLSMLCFFIMRSLLVLNTPDVVHVPRITLNEETLNNEYYQFRNDLYENPRINCSRVSYSTTYFEGAFDKKFSKIFLKLFKYR